MIQKYDPELCRKRIALLEREIAENKPGPYRDSALSQLSVARWKLRQALDRLNKGKENQ